MFTADESRWGHFIAVNEESGCWLWTSTLDRYGYAKWDGQKVHRLVFEEANGTIPGGLPLDHLCRIRHCVNPEHLEVVTKAENDRRGQSPLAVNARKTHCDNGHEFTPENTYVWRGSRACRTCRADVQSRRVRSKAGA